MHSTVASVHHGVHGTDGSERSGTHTDGSVHSSDGSVQSGEEIVNPNQPLELYRIIAALSKASCITTAFEKHAWLLLT
jgi:hypothetical protein